MEASIVISPTALALGFQSLKPGTGINFDQTPEKCQPHYSYEHYHKYSYGDSQQKGVIRSIPMRIPMAMRIPVSILKQHRQHKPHKQHKQHKQHEQHK